MLHSWLYSYHVEGFCTSNHIYVYLSGRKQYCRLKNINTVLWISELCYSIYFGMEEIHK